MLYGKVECIAIEKDEKHYTYRYAGVRKIENGVEEGKVFTSYPRKPLGEITVDERKVEHIYHFAVQERGISSLWWKKGS